MTGPPNGPSSLPTWLELRDAVYLAACQDAADPYATDPYAADPHQNRPPDDEADAPPGARTGEMGTGGEQDQEQEHDTAAGAPDPPPAHDRAHGSAHGPAARNPAALDPTHDRADDTAHAADAGGPHGPETGIETGTKAGSEAKAEAEADTGAKAEADTGTAPPDPDEGAAAASVEETGLRADGTWVVPAVPAAPAVPPAPAAFPPVPRAPSAADAWPATPPFPGSLALGRALRPLRLFRPAPGTRELDEEATSERIAADGLWLPVTRPARERRLSLSLLIDTNPSMAVWQDTVRRLRELMEQAAAFRRISTSRLDITAVGSLARRRRAVPVAGDPGPDRLQLVVTDGVARAWRNGDAAAYLCTAAQGAPTAVLSLMPQELWEFTLPSAVRAELTTPDTAAPNRRLAVRRTISPAAGLDDPPPPRSGRSSAPPPVPAPAPVPLPLLELTPGSFGSWARLVASAGGRHDLAVLLTGADGDQGARPSHHSVPVWLPGRADETVRRFARKASPTAFALARRLAAAPLNLPVMRLIQRALPGAEDWNLAEILLFGLLRRTDHGSDVEDTEHVSFDFAEGVREELLALGTRAETIGVLRQVSTHLGPRLACSVPGGATVVAWQADAPVPPVSDRTRPFVRPLRSALLAVSGPYLARGIRLERLLNEKPVPYSPPLPPEAPARSPHPYGNSPPPEGLRARPLKGLSPPESSGDDVSTPSTPSTPSHSSHPSPFIPPLQASHTEAVPPRLWGNVPQKNRNFTGREELLARLHTRLTADDDNEITAVLPEALHGMGGVGKSQIAVEYVYRNSTEYDLVWWISAEQTNQIVQSFIELGEGMHLRAGTDRGAVPAVLEALRVGEPYANWLLVFDNAENPHEVRKFFPNGGPGRVLVTSRNSQWSHLASSLEVDVFAREESIALIRRRSPHISDESADRLAEALGDLPLAVEQAAVWLAETGMPVDQYLDLFDTKYAELLRVAPPVDYDLPVAAAWNVSLDRLREDHPSALQLLQVCAFFAPEPIDWYLFSAVRGIEGPSALRATLDDPIKLGRAVREIGRYALARIDHRKSTVQVHRLVQRVLIERMSEVERKEMRHCAHQVLAYSDPRNPQRSPDWPRYAALLPHVRATRLVECEDPWARELILNEARFLIARTEYEEALDAAEEAAGAWRQKLGEDDEHVIAADQARAMALRWNNRYNDAYEVQSELVERCRRVLGERHEASQRALSFMAVLLRARGEFHQSSELDRQAYETTLREFGPDDPGTLMTAHNYAVSLRLAGNAQKAYEHDEDTHQRRVEVLGDDHLQTLLSRHCLYIDLQQLGKYQEALEGQENLRVKAASTLGEEHALTGWVTRELTVIRRKLGDHAGALALSSQVMDLYKTKRKTDKHGNAWAALNYATDLRQTGDLAGAVALGREVMELCREVMGPHHPHTYATATNLAVAHRLRGQITEARELNRVAAEGLISILGPDHPFTLLTMTNLASDLAALGETQEAHDIGVELLARSDAARGENHPETLAIRLNLSYDLKALGRTAEALEMYETTLAKFREVLGPDHQATRDAVGSLRANCDIDMLII
ncbi:FxSxx-COOH system tetratricopeptide repeat protein [Streptomyces hiroshimensis]|uniref:Cytochrome c n=1 Tax=Streptomyces hiroshimensis TaxID=66424 RepID=A0ABQ2YUH3_9ACTN|nr:FxSxx-COOH system tetratricopeptide repeat protein [Streptomyces hiroshimensis]GGX93554.1 cytochrome c [Streptomyces hiroshimensis]